MTSVILPVIFKIVNSRRSGPIVIFPGQQDKTLSKNFWLQEHYIQQELGIGDFLGWVTLTKAPSDWVLTLLIPNTYFVEVVYKHSFLWTIWIIEPNSSPLYVHYTNLYTIKLALKISNKYLVSAVSSKKMIFKRIGIPKKNHRLHSDFKIISLQTKVQ